MISKPFKKGTRSALFAATTTTIACAVLMLLARSAHAEVARHEREEIKEIKKGGEVVGIKVKMTLRPDRYVRARVGLGPVGKTFSTSEAHRPAASDPSKGHLLHQFEEVTLEPNKPKEVEFTVLYKDAPKLKPGMKVELISAFNNDATNKDYWHVYGMTSRINSSAKSYDLPGKAAEEAQAAPQRRMLMSEIRRASSRQRARSPQLRYRRQRASAPRPARARSRKPVRAPRR